MLEVQLFDGLERQSLTVQIDSAGRILLPLINEIEVGGLTARDAAELIRERYRVYYVDPIINLLVQDFGQLRIFVFGPDIRGRVVSLSTGATLLDLLSSAALSPAALNAERLERFEPYYPAANGNGSSQMRTELPSGFGPVFTPGTFRRLHLLRSPGSFEELTMPSAEALAPGSSASASSGGAVPLQAGGNAQDGAVSIQVSAGGVIGNSLTSAMNWRRWIAERQQHPDSLLWVIDPLRITLDGELSRYNLPLQDGDVLYVPVPERFAEITGVSRPGRYELLGSETLGDLLRMAGSMEYGWNLRNAVVQRYSSDGRLSRIVANLHPGLDDIAQLESFPLENRDRISILPAEERVFVLGEVNAAGAFPHVSFSTVLDYLALAEGETERAHLAWIAVIRQNRDLLEPGAAPQVLRLNFKELHKGYPSCAEVSPQPGDIIYVPPKGREFELAPVLQAIGTVVSGYALIDRARNN